MTTVLSEPAEGAAEGSLPAPPASCESAGSIPTVESGGDNGSGLRLNACAGEILFTSQSCAANPCATQAKVEKLASMLGDLGTNGGN